MAGSPREEEKPGFSGAAAIVKHLANKANNASDYVKSMPFTGRKTYRAVLNREELAIIFEDVAANLARLETCASIKKLCEYFANSIKQASEMHAHTLTQMRAQEKNDETTQGAR